MVDSPSALQYGFRRLPRTVLEAAIISSMNPVASSTSVILSMMKPSGGLGNRLFQWNLLAQLAFEHSAKVVTLPHPDFRFLNPRLFLRVPSLTEMKAIRSAMVLPRDAFLPAVYPATRDLFRDSWLRFGDKPVAFRIQPGVLGEAFSTVTRVSPRRILMGGDIDVAHPSSRPGVNTQTFRLAIHARGRDFHQWDRSAIMGTKYFSESIRIVSSGLSSSPRIELYTDDPSLESVKYLRDHYDVHMVRGLTAMSTLRRMARSDALIASPSTFSVWGALLGNQSTVVYPRDWVRHRASRGDEFWAAITNNDVPFHPPVYLG